MIFISIIFTFCINIPFIIIDLILGVIIFLLGKKFKDERTKKYGYNLLITEDQKFNVITGGDPDEVFSSRTEKAKVNGQLWAKIISKFLDIFEKDHTKKSLERDEGKNQILKN